MPVLNFDVANATLNDLFKAAFVDLGNGRVALLTTSPSASWTNPQLNVGIYVPSNTQWLNDASAVTENSVVAPSQAPGGLFDSSAVTESLVIAGANPSLSDASAVTDVPTVNAIFGAVPNVFDSSAVTDVITSLYEALYPVQTLHEQTNTSESVTIAFA